MKKIFIAVSCLLLLTSCGDDATELYVFGPGKSCYHGDYYQAVKDCKSYAAYNKLILNANMANQEVTYQLVAAGLDSSNVVFKTLTSCKIIDKKNFSCDGFSISDGKPIDTKIFGRKIVSNVGWLFSVSTFFENEIKVDHINYVTKNNYWLAPLMVVGFIFAIFGIAS